MFGVLTWVKLGAIAALVAWGAFGHWKASSIQAAWNVEKLAQANAYAKGLDKLHADHDAQLQDRERAINEGAKQLDKAKAVIAADSAVVRSLHDTIAAVRAAALANTGTVSPGEAADRLGSVADGCLGRLEALAGRTREALARHRQCASEYEAMRQKKP